MQRDETELARVGRRAGDDDAPRFEERAESRVARTDSAVELAVRGCRRRIELDERVDRDRFAVDHDQRVDVDRHDVGAVGCKLREPDQRRRHGRAVDGGFAAEGPEQLLGRQIVEQIARVEIGERGEAEGDVTHGFREHSPDAEHHARAELRIAHEPGDELARAACHRRDQ